MRARSPSLLALMFGMACALPLRAAVTKNNHGFHGWHG